MPDGSGAVVAERNALAIGAALTAIGGAAGIIGAFLFRRSELGQPWPPGENIFYVMVARLEPPFLALGTLFALAVCLVAPHLRRATAEPDGAWPRLERWPLGAPLLALAALLFVLVAWVGSRVVLHSYPFSMDEYNAVFQARILAAGHVAVAVPAEWQRFARALTPVWVSYKSDEALWITGYLPGYSAIRALFHLVGVESFTNPVLGGLSLVAIFAAARRLWPDSPGRAWLAMLFLGVSSQFLLTSMSWYSMPAHLFMNLVWLWLYLRGGRLGFGLAPFVGVFALALHNPFPHALFVIPFAIRMLRERRWKRLLYFGAIYVPGALACLAWLSYARVTTGGSGLLDLFAIPDSGQLMTQMLQLSLVLSWQSPVVALFPLVALLRWPALSATERDLCLGLIITAAFYFFFPTSQGHGWGYRYVYNVLGNLVLLAVAGAAIATQAIGERWTRRLVVASVAVTLLGQWPLRLIETERVVRPFARAAAFIQSVPEAAVVVETESGWYARDLVRNDPFFTARPKVFAAPLLSAEDLAELQRRSGDRVRFMRSADLARLGLYTAGPSAAAIAQP